MTGLIWICLLKRREGIKTPGEVLLHGEPSESLLHESFMAYRPLMPSKKKSQRGKNIYINEKTSFCVWHLLPNIQLRLYFNPGSMCQYSKTKRFLWMCRPMSGLYTETNWNCLFPLCYRLSGPPVLLTLLSWWLHLSGSLHGTKAPLVTESHYTIKPGGNGSVCNAVVSYIVFILYYMGSLNLPASLKRLASGEDTHTALWCEFVTM